MGFQLQNLTSRAFLMKVLELLFAFIVFMIFRLGNSGDALHWGFGLLVPTERSENDLIMGILTSTGYFLIIFVLMIGIAMGDKSKISMFIFNLFGFLFYIGMGSSEIYIYRSQNRPADNEHKANAMGAMAILTSFVFLVDMVWSVLDILQNTPNQNKN